MDSRFLSLLGLCKRAGKLCAGEAAALEAVNARKARLALAAEDSSEHVLRKLTAACGERVPLMRLRASKAELGAALGWQDCAAAAVLDMGFAEKLAQMAAAEQGEYAGLAAGITEKREKMRRRKQEKPGKKRSASRFDKR